MTADVRLRSRRQMLGTLGAGAAGAGAGVLLVRPDAALASAPGGYEMASTRGIAPGNTAAANTTGFNSAMTALANGGTLICDWDGTVQLNFGTAITVPDGVQIIGRGRKTIIKANHEGLTTNVNCFRSTGTSSITFADITLDGVASYGTNGAVQMIYHDGTGGVVRLFNVRVRRCTFGIHVSPSGAPSASVDAVACTFEGNNTAASSTPILCSSGGTGTRGKSVSVFDCEFTKFGETASQLSHALYLANDYDVLIVGCRFLSSVGNGFCVQLYDANVSAANASKSRLIEGCLFGPSLTCLGMVTPGVGVTNVRNCIFENPRTAIYAAGKTDIDGCLFAGGTSAEDVIDNFGDWTGRVSHCRFMGSASGGVAIDQSTNQVTIDGCRFELSAYTFAATVSAGILIVRGCEFEGTPGSTIVSISGGTSVTVNDNDFRFGGSGTAGIWNRSTSTLPQLNVCENNFSQSAGTGVLVDATPSDFHHVDNYGSAGPGIPE